MVTYTVVMFGRLLRKKLPRITIQDKNKKWFCHLIAYFNRATKQLPDL